MLMNIVTLIVNHMLARANTAEAGSGILPMFTRTGVRKILMICAGIMTGLVLFLGGFFTVLMDLILTSRENQQLMLSPASIVGFSLIGVSFLFMLGLFSRKLWETLPHQQARSETPAVSPVQEAMAELIRDFVDERRLSREMAMAQFAAQEQAQAASEAAMAESMVNSETEHRPQPSIYN